METHRRRGNIAAARLFGKRRIADEPPLVYLVAPALRFHRSFGALARAVTPEIEMYRFDLNEDWRAGVRVARRVRIVWVTGRRVEQKRYSFWPVRARLRANRNRQRTTLGIPVTGLPAFGSRLLGRN